MAVLCFDHRRASACALALLLCAGCASTGDRAAPAQPLAAEQLGLDSGAATDWPAPDWWRAFGDPQLDRLIETAQAGSPSMQIAEARVQRARQARALARADADPQLALNADVGRQRYSENYIYPAPLGGGTFTEARAFLDFSYEFDFWGGQRARVMAAQRQLEAERAERESARLVLSVAVARTYAGLARSHTELALAEASLRQRSALLDIYQLRIARGLASAAEAEPHRAALAAAQQDLAVARLDRDNLRRQLAALLGLTPDGLGELQEPNLAAGAVTAPTALPADLLGRRPDIVAQRLRAEAAAGDVTAARAEFYPNINLTAFFGLHSLGLDDLVESGSREYGAGPALHLPIFNRALLRAGLGAREADYDLAVAQYNRAVLDALREVADRGAALGNLAEQRRAADANLAATRRAYDYSALRQRRGVASQLEVLNAETALLAQQRVQAALRERELEAALGLIRALGGGYTAPQSEESKNG